MAVTIAENEDRILISPATTPGSVRDEISFLVPHSASFVTTREPWYKKYPPPYALLTASVLQILIFATSNETLENLFTFEPNNKKEAWRFLTYMLLHDSWFHLSLNVIIQCLFAATLEKKQGHLRVGALYLGGGAIGAYGAACVRPDLVIGASAGVYALLTSHISLIILNFDTIKYKTYRCISVIIIVASDVGYNLGHFYFKGHPIISWGAHAVGAIAGFVLGLTIYKTFEKQHKTRFTTLFWTGLILLIIVIMALTIVNFQILKCTPKELLFLHYEYIC